MGFSRQEYWSGLPCPPPEDLPNPGIKPRSPALQEDALPSELPGKYIILLEEAKFKNSSWPAIKKEVDRRDIICSVDIYLENPLCQDVVISKLIRYGSNEHPKHFFCP